MIGSKNSQNSEQFMIRSGNHSTKPSAKGYSLLGGGESPLVFLTDEERCENLLASRNALDRRIGKLTSALKGNKISHDDRQEIAAKRQRLKDELLVIRAQHEEMAAKLRGKKERRDLSHFIADIVREQMTVPQWNCIVEEARQRFSAHEESLKEQS